MALAALMVRGLRETGSKPFWPGDRRSVIAHESAYVEYYASLCQTSAVEVFHDSPALVIGNLNYVFYIMN